MNVSYQNVLERLKEERLQKNWSQEQISRQLKMSQSHYSKVELGKKRFTYYEVRRLYDLELDAHYIFTGNKSGIVQEAFFADCDYRELHFYLHVLAYMAEYVYLSKRVCRWESVYQEVEYIKYLTAPERANDSTLFTLRRILDYSQQKMAGKLGVDVKKVRAMENGESLPDSEILWNLYRLFRIPPAVMARSQRGMAEAVCGILDMLAKGDRERVLGFLQSCHGMFSD